MDSGAGSGTGDEVATILEFFGIKLTTPSQHFAEFLQMDVGDLLHTDVKDLFGQMGRDKSKEESQD